MGPNRHKTGISLSNSLTKTGINRHKVPILQHYACLAVNSFTRENLYKTGIRVFFG